MTRRIHEYREPERFITGTVGMPGERTFFLQARTGNDLTSVVVEKQQVSVLSERIDDLLDEVTRRRESGIEIPAAGVDFLADAQPLEVPITEEFRVGAMALGWDDASLHVVVEAHAITEEDQEVPELADDDPDAPDTLRVWLTPVQARSFAERARHVVAAGRPPCPFCQQPLDPAGHICPRANGYRRRG